MPPELLHCVAEQDGIVTRAQALEAGMMRHQIEWALRADGPWQRVLHGVYATFTGPLGQSHRERAALLACGDHAQLAALTACRRFELRYLPADDGMVHILLPDSVHKRSRGFLAVGHTNDPPRPWSVGGLPTSPIHQAVVDACREMDTLRGVRALMCEAVQRRRTTVGHLADRLARGPSAGSGFPGSSWAISARAASPLPSASSAT